MKRNERKKKGKKMLFPSPGTTQYLSLGRLEKVISFIGEQNSKTTIHAFPLWRATIINYKSSQQRSECFQHAKGHRHFKGAFVTLRVA